MTASAPDPDSAIYIAAVLALYVDLPDTPIRTSIQDQWQARRLRERGVPLHTVESALLLASLRRLMRPNDVPSLPLNYRKNRTPHRDPASSAGAADCTCNRMCCERFHFGHCKVFLHVPGNDSGQSLRTLTEPGFLKDAADCSGDACGTRTR